MFSIFVLVNDALSEFALTEYWVYVLMVKSTVEILQNFADFSEYMNFNSS